MKTEQLPPRFALVALDGLPKRHTTQRLGRQLLLEACVLCAQRAPGYRRSSPGRRQTRRANSFFLARAPRLSPGICSRLVSDLDLRSHVKAYPLSLAIDFVAIRIVLVRPVSVVRDYAQLSAQHSRSSQKLATRDGIETVESQRIKSGGLIRRGSQVVRPRSAKPLFTGSIPVPASPKIYLRNDTVTLQSAFPFTEIPKCLINP